MLTSQQQKEIRLKLLNSGIKYYEVYQELSDHYFSAVEERLKAGSSFEEALAVTHVSFGTEEGLQKLQKYFASSAIKQYRQLHWREFLQRFHWPHVVYIFAAAAVAYAVTDVVAPEVIIVALFLISMVPFGIAGFTGGGINDTVWGNHVFMPKTLRGMALRQQAVIVMSLFNVIFFGSKLVFGDQIVRSTLTNLHQAFIASLIVFVFVWSWSFYVTVRTTRPRLT